MKKVIANIALAFTSIAVFLIVLEIVFRFLGQPTYHFEKNDADFIQYDSLLNYKYTPNLDVNISSKDYSVNVQTNSFGYRDDEWSFSSELEKILVIGNSYAAGFGIEKEQRWSDILETNLNKNDSTYMVYNAAISGYSLNQALRTADYLSPKIDPGTIILGLFICGLNRLENPFIYYEGYSIRKSKLEYAKIYKGELFVLHFQNSFLQTIETLLYKHSALYNFTVRRLMKFKDKFFPPPPKTTLYGLPKQ